jgi:uncharacterized protein (DUF2141 family)
MKILRVLAALAAMMTAAMAWADDEANLRIVVGNVQSEQGSIVVWVYEKPDDWLSERYRTQKAVKVAGHRENGTVTVELKLPAGEYALSVFQDLNDDGKLARNFIGLPKEPAGLSNNAVPRFGPPRYKDAKFTLGATPVVQQIRLQ